MTYVGLLGCTEHFTEWHLTENTRWFKYDRDWFVCKQAALRSSCAVRLAYIHIIPGHIWTTL